MTTLYCIGDSLTYGPGIRVSRKWTSLVTAEHLQVVNLGVCGDTATGMLARLQPLLQENVYRLAPQERPMVLVMGGSNDLFFCGSDLTARSAVSAMVHQLSSAGYRPIIGIPLPICPEDAPQKWSALADFNRCALLLEEYCRWLKTFASAFEIPFVDFRRAFTNPDSTPRRELFLDGLHPNTEGHLLMAQTLREVLK